MPVRIQNHSVNSMQRALSFALTLLVAPWLAAQAPPVLTSNAPVVNPGQTLTYTLAAPANRVAALGLTFANVTPSVPTPWGLLGIDISQGVVLTGVTDGVGAYSYSILVPPGFFGFTLYGQALVFDAGYTNQAALSTDGMGSEATAIAIVAGSTITTSGTITFEDPVYVPGQGYPASSTVLTPVRFADIELVNANTLSVMQTGTTNGSGNYAFTFPTQAAPVFVRAKASTDGTPSLYRIRVRMAPSGGATPTATEPIWSRSSPNFAGNTTNQAANWTIPVDPGTSQTANFDSGPFNILEVMQRVQDGVRSTLGVLAQVSAYTTPNEGTTGAFYGGIAGGEHYIFISGGTAGGAESSDTDFYDDGVLGHEFGHFLEAVTFGSSSFGGFHSGGERTIPSLAFGEGFGTWIGGVALGSPLYADGGGFGANSVVGFTLNLESDPSHTGLPNQTDGPQGIHDEYVVFETLWDLVDGGPDLPTELDNDGIALSLAQVFALMSTYTNNDAIYLMTILSKLDAANGGPLATASLSSLSTSPEATGWTYPPVGSDIWPTPLTVGAVAYADSIDATANGTIGFYPSGNDWYNVAEANALYRFIATQTSHTVTLTHTSPSGGSVPHDLDLATLNPRRPVTNAQVDGGPGITTHTINYTGLTVGNTYLVWVRGWTSPSDPTSLFAFGGLNAAQSTSFTVRVQ